MRVKKAVIPAAGLGTRFLPATKAQPKEMLPIVDKPTIQYIVEEAIQSGIEDIIIVTGRGKTSIEDHFDKSYELEATLDAKGKMELLNQVEHIANMASIYYVRQKEPKGLGHAIWCARKFIGNEPFAVMLGDDVIISEKPCLKQMIGMYEKYESPILGIREVSKCDVSKYGIIQSSGNLGKNTHNIIDMVEKPRIDRAPSNLAIMGRYILIPEILDILEHTRPGSGGEVQLTDAIRELNKSRRIIGYEFEGLRYDVGDKFGFIKANLEFALSRDDLGDELRQYLLELVSSNGFISNSRKRPSRVAK